MIKCPYVRADFVMARQLFPIRSFAACSVSVAPLRREPSHRAEQVSQLLFGERAEILVRDEARDWAHIRCEWDGYEGWCKWGQLAQVSAKDFHAPKRLLSTTHSGIIRLDAAPLPLAAELTGIKKGTVPVGENNGRFKGKKADISSIVFSVEALTDACRLLMHAPYQWGGRSLAGIDCSGFVQVAAKLCGLRILRDAAQQAMMGREVHFLQEAEAGDFAFFDNDEGRIVHVGILIDKHSIIHATDTSGRVVIDTIDNGGIISRSLRRRTHKLRTIRRIRP